MRLFAASVVIFSLLSVVQAEAQGKATKKKAASQTAAPSAVAPSTPAPYVSPSAPAAPASADAFRAPEVREIDGRVHGGFKWDAFIDSELTIPNKADLNGLPIRRGFTVNDAALFLTKDFGRATALVQLPFSSDIGGASDSLNFAASRAQAYVQWTKWNPVMLRFGQYASFFGVEPNDSRDRMIANEGFIKRFVLPKTHTGLQVGYQAQAISLRGQITDQADRNALGSDNPEFAAFGRFDGGPGYGALGFSYQDSRTNTTLNKTNMLVNLMGGIALNKFRIDGEVDIKKTAQIDKTANAFGLFGAFPIDNDLALGARIEYLKDAVVLTGVPGAATADSIVSFAVGPAYKIQQDLTLRGDFTLGSIKTATSDDTLFGFNVSLVAEL